MRVLRLSQSLSIFGGRHSLAFAKPRWIQPLSTAHDPRQHVFISPHPSIDRKTKIVCTVGPATDSKDNIMQLLQIGMNVMRLNCSHGNETYYKAAIGNLRQCLVEVREQCRIQGVDFSDGAREDICAIALDTKGPEIRTGEYSQDAPREVKIQAGSQVTLYTDEKYRTNQTGEKIYVDYAEIGDVLKVGGQVFIDDGLLRMEVKSINNEDGSVLCIAKNSATLGEHKGINLPGVEVTLPAVSDKDKQDLKFAKAAGVDFIFASFVRKANHIKEIRDIVGDSISIIAKIENAEGLNNVEEIIEASDGIMVARGDLGIEIPIENVFLAQKRIVHLCNVMGKPVICATQMLESMVSSPRPTRAECSDVANAVLDGADCVMLSGETAKGKYPVEAVRLMSKICQTAECVIDYRETCDTMRKQTLRPKGTSEALVLSAVVASFDENAKAIMILAKSGRTAMLAAKYRPHAPILCVTSNARTARRLQLTRGVHAIMVPQGMVASSDMTAAGLRAALEMKVCDVGDRVVVIHSEFRDVTSTDPTASVMKLMSIPGWLNDSYNEEEFDF